jgi:hypothetical protein
VVLLQVQVSEELGNGTAKVAWRNFFFDLFLRRYVVLWAKFRTTLL